jgi:urease accessory protein
MNTGHRFLAAFVLMLPATLAVAHPGHELQPGWVAGMLHPWSGLDHLLAMLAVGIWAAQLGGRMRWAVPLSFVTLMLVGAGMGMSGIKLGAVEQGIAASVCVLGLLIATAVRVPVLLSVALTGCFAVFHGYAHDMEAPLHSNALLYMSGFALSTITLHILGFMLARALVRHQQQASLQWTGAAIALSGLALLAV